MRTAAALVIGFAFTVLLGMSTARAADVIQGCAICTCQNEAVLCVGTAIMEQLEELGPCAGVCSQVESSFKSIKLVEAVCEDLPTCDHAFAPAASPLWLSGGAFALLLLGGATLRRVHATAAH